MKPTDDWKERFWTESVEGVPIFLLLPYAVIASAFMAWAYLR